MLPYRDATTFIMMIINTSCYCYRCVVFILIDSYYFMCCKRSHTKLCNLYYNSYFNIFQWNHSKPMKCVCKYKQKTWAITISSTILCYNVYYLYVGCWYWQRFNIRFEAGMCTLCTCNCKYVLCTTTFLIITCG